MDSALFGGRCTHEDLARAIATLSSRFRARAQRALESVDPQAESVGETRTRIILVDAGFSLRSQVTGHDETGVAGRVDFLVDDCVVVEFDGLKKYGGDRGQAALAAEKAREERLTRLGYEVVRVVWAELDDPAAIVRRVRRARALARERRAAHTRGGTSGRT
jgi:very-short-patch-repair endonuclease